MCVLKQPLCSACLKQLGKVRKNQDLFIRLCLVLHALESHNMKIQTDRAFNKFVEKMHNFSKLPALAISQ